MDLRPARGFQGGEDVLGVARPPSYLKFWTRLFSSLMSYPRIIPGFFRLESIHARRSSRHSGKYNHGDLNKGKQSRHFGNLEIVLF